MAHNNQLLTKVCLSIFFVGAGDDIAPSQYDCVDPTEFRSLKDELETLKTEKSTTESQQTAQAEELTQLQERVCFHSSQIYCSDCFFFTFRLLHWRRQTRRTERLSRRISRSSDNVWVPQVPRTCSSSRTSKKHRKCLLRSQRAPLPPPLP